MFEKMAKPFVNTFIFHYIIKTKIYLAATDWAAKSFVSSLVSCLKLPSLTSFFLLCTSVWTRSVTRCTCWGLCKIRGLGNFRLIVTCWLSVVTFGWSWYFISGLFFFFASSYNLPLAVITKECFVFKEIKTRAINFVNESSFLLVCSTITFCLISVNCIIVSYRHIVAFWLWSRKRCRLFRNFLFMPSYLNKKHNVEW